jgi:hypothetical protein
MKEYKKYGTKTSHILLHMLLTSTTLTWKRELTTPRYTIGCYWVPNSNEIRLKGTDVFGKVDILHLDPRVCTATFLIIPPMQFYLKRCSS